MVTTRESAASQHQSITVTSKKVILPSYAEYYMPQHPDPTTHQPSTEHTPRRRTPAGWQQVRPGFRNGRPGPSTTASCRPSLGTRGRPHGGGEVVSADPPSALSCLRERDGTSAVSKPPPAWKYHSASPTACHVSLPRFTPSLASFVVLCPPPGPLHETGLYPCRSLFRVCNFRRSPALGLAIAIYFPLFGTRLSKLYLFRFRNTVLYLIHYIFM